MDRVKGELTPQQQAEWEMYLKALDEEKRAIEARKQTEQKCAEQTRMAQSDA